MSKRVCIPSGYRYRFAGGKSWGRRANWDILSTSHAKNDMWEIEAGKATCGTLVGERRIDGTPVIVISTGRGGVHGGGQRRFYAAGVQQVESRTRGKLRAPRGGK